MTTAPYEAAIEAAAKAIWEHVDDEIGWEASQRLAAEGDRSLAANIEWTREDARRAILAALPHLGEPVGYMTIGSIERLRTGLSMGEPVSKSAVWAAAVILDGQPQGTVPVFLAPPVPAALNADGAEPSAYALRRVLAGAAEIVSVPYSTATAPGHTEMIAAPAADADADYADIGREIVSTIGRYVNDPGSPLHDWSPAETYGEVIDDLIEMIDEAKAAVPDWVADFLNRRCKVETALRKGQPLLPDEMKRLAVLLSVPSEYPKAPPIEPLKMQLIEALRPLATIADEYGDQEDDDFQVWKDFDLLGATLPLKHFRRARAALAALEGNQ